MPLKRIKFLHSVIFQCLYNSVTQNSVLHSSIRQFLTPPSTSLSFSRLQRNDAVSLGAPKHRGSILEAQGVQDYCLTAEYKTLRVVETSVSTHPMIERYISEDINSQITHLCELTNSIKQSSLEKLTGPQLVKKFSKFYGSLRFITAFTTALHSSLS
jgi:hypothetical protein